MTRRLLVIAALLSALPASGSDATLAEAVVEALTPIDASPSRPLIDAAFQAGSGSSGLNGLVAIATDPTNDLGIQIRAIRALPLYCPTLDDNCAGTPVHDALLAIVQGYVTSLRQTPPATLAPQDLLRLRAAIESLGATRSELASDVDVLAMDPSALLRHPSRDVRVTVARALRDLRSCAAITPLDQRRAEETVEQVNREIFGALQSLRAPMGCR